MPLYNKQIHQMKELFIRVYSHLSNNRGGWNQRVKDAKSTGLFPSIFELE